MPAYLMGNADCSGLIALRLFPASTSDPDQNTMINDAGQRIHYEAMVLATGLQCREPKATAGHS